MKTSAELSPCRSYRYSLTREWGVGPRVLFVMLNPSTANETDDDPTIRRCISFGKAWGFGALTVGNLFAFRTPSPSVLFEAKEPIGELNDHWLNEMSNAADLTVAAWGNNGNYMGRGKDVALRLNRPHSLRITSIGEPSHPLYIPGDTKPTPWVVEEA